MKKGHATLLIWSAAVLAALVLAFYQRLTGPTHPLRGSEVLDGEKFSYRLLRSFDSGREIEVRVKTASSRTIFIEHRLLNSDAPLVTLPLKQGAGYQFARLPGQPAAAKISYRLFLKSDDREAALLKGKTVTVRFKNPVPGPILLLHILFMFMTPILAFAAFFRMLQRNPSHRRLFLLATLSLLIGGFLLGPLVQKAAFGVYWSGFPLGGDLTDNKTLLQLAVWLLALAGLKKRPWLLWLAIGAMLMNFLIPHSLLGSEFDFRTQALKK